MLVDTPGLNQNLNSDVQIGNIADYYRKADGVIWLIDGNTIAAENTQALIAELESSLNSVGGIRGNIIGVINRMDLIMKNGGSSAINRVKEIAESAFGDKFSMLIPISAKSAYIGIKENDTTLYESSGLNELIHAIEHIFINRADEVKTQAKKQSDEKLEIEVRNISNDFAEKKDSYLQLSNRNINELNQKIAEHFDEQIDELNKFLDDYMSQVSNRAFQHIDRIGNGEDPETVINKYIYKPNDFGSDLADLLLSFEKSTLRKIKGWCNKYSYNEYKYIIIPEVELELKVTSLSVDQIGKVSNVKGFTPAKMDATLDGVIGLLGNIIGGLAFSLRKNSESRKIIANMQKYIDAQKETLTEQIKNMHSTTYSFCYNNSVGISFSKLFYPVIEPHDQKICNMILHETDYFRESIFFNKQSMPDVSFKKKIEALLIGN